MGFTTGLTGGVTLTLGLAYLSVVAHERNRQAQALYLRSQSQLLTSLVDPTPIAPLSRAEVARQSRSTFTETAKDRWNSEIENAIRWVQATDWDGVREGMEGAVARMLGLGLEKSRESIEEAEKKLKPKVQEAVDRSKEAASKGAEQTAIGVDRAAAATIAIVERAPETARSGAERSASSATEGLNQLGTKTQEIASATRAGISKAATDVKAATDRTATSTRGAMDRGVEKSNELAEKARTEVQSTGAGTIDAARGALRDVISKGIEKGKEVISKAQAAAGLTTEKTESTSQSNALGLGVSDVEKALRERYERPNGLSKTAEEVLQERYKPIDERDNTVLRGI